MTADFKTLKAKLAAIGLDVETLARHSGVPLAVFEAWDNPDCELTPEQSVRTKTIITIFAVHNYQLARAAEAFDRAANDPDGYAEFLL
jgi:hypothetical protein